MALATKCPQCGALFRVVADQLKLRGGLVRCGQCRAVFDAIGSLTYVDDGVLTPSRPASHEATSEATARASPAEEAAVARNALGRSTTLRISPVAPATLAGNLPSRSEPFKPTLKPPAVVRRRSRTATGTRTEATEARGEATSTGVQGALPTLMRPDLPREPQPVQAPVAQENAPVADLPTESDTVTKAGEKVESDSSFARPKPRKRKGFSIVYGGGTALLVVLAAIQMAVIFRGQLMVHWPQARLVLTDLCGVFQCTVSWPTQADRLAVIGTELQAIPGTDAFELSAVIRNRADFRQSLPAVEVTLTDARNRALARKVFTPADYLASAGEPTARLQEGLAPGSDFTIRILFEARGLAAAGFLVYPFYL